MHHEQRARRPVPLLRDQRPHLVGVRVSGKQERPKNEPKEIKNARLARQAKAKGIVVKIVKKGKGRQ